MGNIGQPLIRLAGALFAVGVVIAALLPARGHVSDVSIGLLLVVPLIAAVAIGGFEVGAVATAVTFVLYDLIYVPPYGKLTVQNNESLLPLVVYAAILVTAPLATNLRRARADAERRALEAQRLFELTEALITNRPLDDLLSEVVTSVRASFGLESAALLVASDEGLEVAAETGLGFNEEELRLVAPTGGVPRSLGSVTVGSRHVLGVPLAATGEPIGVLVLAGDSIESEELGALRTYANQAAFALERARLRES
ncbi:MAG TPA: DUF4118 domain-containing protein, partial [Acidimicrobiales bacterium]|nr:DUF4118 domain-containing protein [Acidimicrobiales bacterium]